MTDAKSLKDDIAFMKDLAEAGATAPLLGGRITVFSGVLFSLASVMQWWLQENGASPWSYPVLWFGSTALCWIVVFFMVGRQRRQPGVRNPANKAANMAWRATGFVIVAISVSAFILSFRLKTFLPFTLMPAIIVSLYGGAWSVAATMSQQKWMWTPAVAAFGLALILSYVIVSPYLFLYFAAALFVLTVPPGLMLVRREPSLIV